MEKYGVVDPGTTPTTEKTLKMAKVIRPCNCSCSLKETAEKKAQLDVLDDDVSKRMATAVKNKCPKGAYGI